MGISYHSKYVLPLSAVLYSTHDRFLQLETEQSLLIPKSRAALERYGHHLVIGNILTTRKHEVVFIQKSSESWLRLNEVEKVEEGREIEEDIVGRLVGMHSAWIKEAEVVV